MYRHLMTCLVAVGLLALTGWSDDKKPAPGEKKEIPKPSPEDIARAKKAQQLAAAYALIEFGRENKSPESLLAAARIIGTTPAVKGKESDDKDKDKVEEDTSVKDEAEKLIKEAVALAKDSSQKEHIEALAQAARGMIAERQRGPVGGQRNYAAKFYPAGNMKSASIDLIGGYTTVTARHFGGGLVRVRVVGELTGLEYANQTGYGTVSVGFNHLPIAKVKVFVTNEGSDGNIQVSIY